MREARHVIGRASLGLFGTLVGWVPPAVMVCWGGTYLSACARYLATGNHGYKYSFEGRDGKVTATADKVDLVLQPFSVRLKNARLSSKSASDVVTAAEVYVQLSNGVPDIRVRKAKGRLERLADGSYDWAKLLPKPGAKKKPFAAHISVDEAEVVFDDLKGNGVLSTPVRASSVDLALFDGTVLAKARVSGSGIRGLPLTIRRNSDGSLFVSGRADHEDISKLLPLAARMLNAEKFKSYGQWSAKSLVVTGPFSVALKHNGPWSLESKVEFKGTGIGVGNSVVGAAVTGECAWRGQTGSLKVVSSEPARSATFDGTVLIGKEWKVAGKVTAHAASEASLWPELKRSLPKGLKVSASIYEGTLYADRAGIETSGQVSAPKVAYGKESLADVRADIRYQPKQLGIRLTNGRWRNSPVEAQLSLDTANNRLSGFVNSQFEKVEQILKQYNLEGFYGSGSGMAIISGTPKAPKSEVLVQGTGFALINDRHVFLGQVEARANVDANGLHLSRGSVIGPNGVVKATGDVAWKTKKINFKVNSGSVDLGGYFDEVGGLGFLGGQVTGTLTKPVFDGNFELYGLQFSNRRWPQVSAAIHADRDRLEASEIQGHGGTGRIDGEASLDFKSGALSGLLKAERIPLQDWVNEKIVGMASLPRIALAGTLRSPVVALDAVALGVHAWDTEIDSIDATLVAGKDGVRVEKGEFRIGEGTGSVTGNVTSAKSGTFAGSFSSIPLARLTQGEEVAIEGQADGKFSVGISEGEPDAGTATLDLKNVAVNTTNLGAGSLQLSLASGQVVASGAIGSIDRYIQLEESRYDWKAKSFDGKAGMYNFLVEDITDGLSNEMLKWPVALQETLKSAKGFVSAQASLTGTADHPNLILENLSGSKLEFGGRQAGSFSLAGALNGDEWSVSKFDWKAGDMTFSGKGKGLVDGLFEANADLANFDMSWLHACIPSLPLASGKATATLLASGRTKQPELQASLDVKDAVVFGDDGRQLVGPLSLDLTDIQANRSRIRASGLVHYQGLDLKADADVPWSALSSSEEQKTREPVSATFVLNERSLDTLTDYTQGIDLTGAKGGVSGQLSVRGMPGDFHLDGKLLAKSDVLKFKDFSTVYKDLDLTATLADNALHFKGSARSLGGWADLDVKAALPDILSGDFSLEKLFDATKLDGVLSLDNFRVKENLPGATTPSDATANGQVILKGTAKVPQISGEVAFTGLKVQLPPEFPKGKGQLAPIVDPTFDGLKLVVESGSRLLTSTADLTVSGGGTLSGTLTHPRFRLPLTVETGLFKLPTTRLTLEPGGTIVASYSSYEPDPPVARVDIDLEGHATVSAKGASPQYETYQITLQLRGNLLDQNPLLMTASSEPSDLTQEQIMAIIGQRDLIEGLAKSAFGGGEQALTSVVMSAAVPAFTSSLTSGLSNNLKLDYLTLEYNPFDQAIFTAGKSLTKNLMIQARRQVSQPADGPLRWELKLSYRLPFKQWFLSRVRLGFGMDQDRPWKLTLDWSTRF